MSNWTHSVENKITGHSLQWDDEWTTTTTDGFNNAEWDNQDWLNQEGVAEINPLSVSWADFKNKMSNWTHKVEDKITGHSLQSSDDAANDAELQEALKQFDDLMKQLKE